jgi:hypothetical protein
MSDSLLETIRRQMKVSEERLKKAGESGDGRKSVPFDREGPNSAKSTKPVIQSETKIPIDALSSEWSAYGQMTPGFLDEIAEFMEESVTNTSEKVRASATPELIRHFQDMEKVRMLLAQWADSAGYFKPFLPDCNFAEMIQRALNARIVELQRWGIQIEFEDAATGAMSCGCTPAFYQATLHVIQYCIEQLRGEGRKPRLSVRVQNAGERMETIFLCESAAGPDPWNLTEAESVSHGSSRSGNVEFRAAQTLLESVGGTLILENISETQRAIRISINNSALSVDRNLKERSRI